MSDDLVRGFIFGLAIMFFAPALSPLVNGRRGRVGSFLFGAILTYVTFKWPDIENHLGPALNAFLIRTASNGFVWSSMIIVTWLYFAVDSLFAPYRGARPTQTKPSFLDRLINSFVSKLPDSLVNDREYLVKDLQNHPMRRFKAQIYFGVGERSFRFANEFDEILRAAGWEQADPPKPIPPDDKVRRGMSIRYGTVAPAYDSGLSLQVTMRKIGIDPWTRESPDLREFDHCFVYIND